MDWKMLNTDDENRIRGSRGDAVTVYDVRMIMNCGECNMHMIGPDGIADSIDDAEDTARILLIRQWNARWTPSDGDAHGLAH